MSSEQGRKPEHSEFNPDFALYCEDGYCVACGNGRWKAHMPGCSIGALLDKIERLQAALREIVDMPSIVIAPDGERSIKMRNEDMRRVAREALDE